MSEKVKQHKNIYLEPIVFHTLNTLFLIVLGVIMVYPLLNTLAISLNEGVDAVRGGIYLWPRKWTLRNFTSVLGITSIYYGLITSTAKTIVGVIMNIFFTLMLAYALSRREYFLARPITLFFVLTMYFNAGLIPNFILMRDLHLTNTFTVYWLPYVISTFNLIVIRTYIRSIPESLVESARIDGSGEFRILFRIITPLCIPTLATIALFVAVGSWNAWFDTMLYNTRDIRLTTLQYELKKMLDSAMQTFGGAPPGGDTSGQMVTVTIRAAATVITAIPILIVYPFLQRYFVTGLTIGSVKE
ncbi:MAG: carbohydrate ABC transporter permease [Oscillospiraceae bacterium]|nr:carbohydrate ABC transporter permease [Oscillospiraceae bacterium]